MTISREEYCKMNERESYWSWENRHLRLDIKRYGINGKSFYTMQPDELVESIEILRKQIDSYVRSISGIDIAGQERHTECIAALQNAHYHLQQKGHNHAS